MTGGQAKRWLQWIYDSDKEYSLRGMRERNCIFIHIPKCAGISLASSLLGNYGGAHATADDYMSVFGAEWFDQAFKFTFVRDPWSRTVSAFDFLRRGGFHADDAAFGEKHLARYPGIADFVAEGLERPEVRNWVHFRDQVEFLIDPRTGRLCADYLGRVETIEKDFRAICERLNISADLKVKNSRENAGGDESLKLDAKTIDKIAQVYARDVEMLGYRNFPLA
ncbi:MAG: sulfotransferase family 2 domain-containing protein [Amphiplicatus sp.]